jgi:hypothetical protein
VKLYQAWPRLDVAAAAPDAYLRDERLRQRRRSARPRVIRKEEILWEEDMQGEQGAADLTAGAETEARLLLARPARAATS